MDTPEEQGFQQIGSLAERIASSPSTLASELRKLPISSETTGTARPALPPPSSTGQQLGVIGADALPAIERAHQAKDADALETALYRSLKPLRTSLRPLTDDRSFDLVGYELVAPLPPGTLATLRALVDKITAPAGPQAVTKAVSRCLMVTKSREQDGVDLRGMIAILSEELAEFPEDVVATACRKWARAEKWWPSLSELRARCQRATRWRRSLAEAVR